MVILQGFPFVNQLDGSENARMNCVPASAAACIRYVTGRMVTPDQLKDSEYGATYTGGTSFARYHDDNADLMRQLGCDAEAYTTSDPGALVAKIHAWLQAGFPVIATIPSAWATVFPLATRNAGNLSTHVVAFYSEEGGLTAMNPWNAQKHTGTDTYWRDRLCYGQVWRVYALGNGASTVAIPAGWTDNGKDTLIAKNGVKIIGGIRVWALANITDAEDVPLAAESYPNPVEVGNPALGAGAVQFFLKSGQVSWTEARGTFKTWDGQEEMALRRAADSAAAQAKDAQKAATAAAGALGDAQAKLVALQAVTDTAQANADALGKQLAEAVARLTATQADLDARAARITELTARVEDLTSQADSGRDLIAALRKALGL